jgi:SsrA-binding protein
MSRTQPTIENRKARHDYEILETHEAGIELIGSEVKSIRAGKASIKEAFARVVKDREVWLFGMHIARYENTDPRLAPDERRNRRLLLHKREIRKLAEKMKLQGLTLIPLKVYFNARNKAKVRLGLAKGKKHHDKRHTLKERDVKREMDRAIKRG